MFSTLQADHVLCLDIETVPAYRSWDECDAVMQKLWERKAEQLRKNEADTPDKLYARAGIYSEFGKIICISTGFLTQKDSGREFRMRSFAGHDEKNLLEEFALLLKQIHDNRSKQGKQPMLLCAHNGKEFDFPYLSRRMVINRIALPPQLDNFGKKPWENQHLDTMELWKFGDYKNFTPLNLLAHILGIPSPKDDIDGSQVGEVYWKQDDLPRITTYCQKDVLTVMQILLRLKNEALLDASEVKYTS